MPWLGKHHGEGQASLGPEGTLAESPVPWRTGDGGGCNVGAMRTAGHGEREASEPVAQSRGVWGHWPGRSHAGPLCVPEQV